MVGCSWAWHTQAARAIDGKVPSTAGGTPAIEEAAAGGTPAIEEATAGGEPAIDVRRAEQTEQKA